MMKYVIAVEKSVLPGEIELLPLQSVHLQRTLWIQMNWNGFIIDKNGII